MTVAPPDPPTSHRAGPEARVLVFDVIDRHFLHSLKMYWSRMIAMIVLQAVLIAIFVIRFGDASRDRSPMAVVLALFGLALAVMSAVLAVATVQRILVWRETLLTSASSFDPDRLIEQAETAFRVTNPTQTSALLPAVAAIAWAALLVIYAVQ